MTAPSLKDTVEATGYYPFGGDCSTSQNQDLLRRISGITNKEVPVEALLVWADLYPVIDTIYNGFYSRMETLYGYLLSEKEKQVCCLLCADFSTKEIGW